MWYHPGWVWKRCQKGQVLHKQGWDLFCHAMKQDSLEMASGTMLFCYGMKSFDDFMDVKRRSCTAPICMFFFHVLYISSCKIWTISFFFHAQRFVVSRQRWSRQLCLPHAAARQKQSYQEENSSEETRPQSRVQWEVLHYLCYPQMFLLKPSNILSVVIFDHLISPKGLSMLFLRTSWDSGASVCQWRITQPHSGALTLSDRYVWDYFYLHLQPDTGYIMHIWQTKATRYFKEGVWWSSWLHYTLKLNKLSKSAALHS